MSGGKMMPLYQCHKQVRAAKITKIKRGIAGGMTELFFGIPAVNHPVPGAEDTVLVDDAWLTRNPALAVGGYFVEYQEGDKYTAYSPAAPFEGGYTAIPGNKSASCGLNFGRAVEALKVGKKVARVGWNGKGMWLEQQTPDSHSKMTLPYVYLNYPDNAQNTPGARVPWLASQTDMLAEDWLIVE